MAQYLYRLAQGDRPYDCLPVFPLPNFTTRDLYVRRRGPMRKPADLTGALPPQHLIVLRREAREANRWIAKSLTDAFSAANVCFTASQKGFPYATPWLEAELEATAAVMGEDVHPYGVERNRAQIEMFAGEAFRLGLTSRRITVEDYFADYLQGG